MGLRLGVRETLLGSPGRGRKELTSVFGCLVDPISMLKNPMILIGVVGFAFVMRCGF